MDNLIPFLSRWIHIVTAIVLVGGTIFLRFVLAPAAAQLSQPEHDKLRELVMNKWKKFVHGGIALFIISGFYNFIFVQVPKHRGDGLYHALIGTKILIAFAIFFIASALVGRSRSFEGMRKNAKMWQLLVVVLALVIVGISSYAKINLPGRVLEPVASAKL
ncbi:hypothetical protein [Schlesneria paludicola]|uniref:hypothetical protein n=1 Tax=Schlesneria paludicola TaxID=360056 RepID=UPI00029AF300|nr:hypothetical protein [Schlesneria paludicola]